MRAVIATTARTMRIACVLWLAGLLGACGGDSKPIDSGSKATASVPAATATVTPQAGNGVPPCKKPQEVAFPQWLPDDLPLPDGTYAYKNLAPIGGYKRALFVLDVGTTPFTKLVLKEWPKAGYTLGRGDAEPGEVEDDFRKPPAVGAFKANDVYCTPGYTVMYLIWAPKGPKSLSALPSPTSTGSPLSK
jgi:hypothetical protein